MIAMTLAEVADTVDGRLAGVADPAATLTGPVVADSRECRPGSLFVALPGERTDGHDHAADAVAAGALAVLAARPVPGPAVLVADPLAALTTLSGNVVRRRLQAAPAMTVVGVTGSAGKTSTKDLLAALLSASGPTIAPPGSLNNELGVPLTLCRVDGDTRFLVVEMGARGRGHIAHLAALASPAIGVVLNVGSAHAELFGSREATAQAKGELVEALPPHGLAVLNADDPLVRAMAARTSARVVLVGAASDADVVVSDVALDDRARARFRLRTPSGSVDVRLALHGAHQVANAAAAAAVALECGLSLERIAEVLGAAGAASRWRMEVTDRPDGVTVVNDAYNANPESVRAALRAVAAMGNPAQGSARRTWAVLGEMLELGADSAREHRNIGSEAARLGITRVVAVGEGARAVREGVAGQRGDEGADWVADAEAAVRLLREEVAPGDVVLVKASRGIGLDRLARQLMLDVLSAGTAEDAR